MVVMMVGGFLTMIAALFVSLIPTTTTAAEPMRIMVVVEDGRTRHFTGVSRTGLVVEALASASSVAHQSFSYRFIGHTMVPSAMFGSLNEPNGVWTIWLNDQQITNLFQATFHRGDLLTVKRIPSS